LGAKIFRGANDVWGQIYTKYNKINNYSDIQKTSGGKIASGEGGFRPPIPPLVAGLHSAIALYFSLKRILPKNVNKLEYCRDLFV